jgi:hypothetical protein
MAEKCKCVMFSFSFRTAAVGHLPGGVPAVATLF